MRSPRNRPRPAHRPGPAASPAAAPGGTRSRGVPSPTARASRPTSATPTTASAWSAWADPVRERGVRSILPAMKRAWSSLAPGLPGVAKWRLAEFRYNPAAQCLVALLFHKQRSDVGRVYVRPLTARRYRRIRVPGTESRLLEIALAADAPSLF